MIGRFLAWVKSFFTKRTAEEQERVEIQMPRTRGKIYTSQIHYLGALQAAANKVYKKYRLEREAWARRPKVKIGALVRVLPGGRHALFQSNIGVIRKPYG